MPTRLPVRRRLAGAARWPVGVALTSWRYIWRTVPLHRLEERGDPASDEPPGLPDSVPLDEIQRPDDGHGPLFHRVYRTRIRETAMTPDAVVGRVAADPDCVAPTEFASFKKVRGEDGEMRVGDEYVVHMAGPWDGPVRVIESTATSFRLAPLGGPPQRGP